MPLTETRYKDEVTLTSTQLTQSRALSVPYACTV